ncbi:glycosyltransferase family 4 protein [Parabacteroides sp. PF5-9]|uniref:glycosyltransferase family 4 protein n=1 Tax=Parabacteroides sp. PF5-9 TaxID=1742404 RepID=UPI00247451E8|nr:glycosyltransferase family 4 protein [Parabacteroides sp. PF5-9]MDH6358486.1 glycosyltransferase involved in cell wall biosynthesis [Parabacteroides sp. PF5-9]
MKILFIIPGSGDSFYCGNCFRDNLQASALRKAGHEVIVMPLYLPLRHASFQADTPLFFPATTFYTAQKFFGKRKMPKWLERFTGSDRMLKVASSMSGTTSARGTEDMTLAMITGEDPAFTDQVNQLIEWLKSQDRPDIIHLSSTLLLGISRSIKEELDIPIICSVQDEEVWIDSLEDQYARIAWKGIADNLHYIDRFITTSHFYKEIIRERIPQLIDVEVIYPGVDRSKYNAPAYPVDPVIGFFYRMNYENGLDILAEAFIQLKKRDSVKRLRLKIGGGYTAENKAFLKKIRKMLEPFKSDVEICESYSLDDHAAFYESITVLSVPLRFNEGVGLYLCEAFAAGRPAVEPATGSFPEIVGDAGITYQENNSDHLADALEHILTDQSLMVQCRISANDLSITRYSDIVLAEKLKEVYHKVFN